ncbi:hypothetical protein [Pseudonocardia sp. GCM10023141]|uniref:hypothetical protein n=1 Tax=Pseudonocardia sp. GCM10023141 TaxID=3252653 RepID=UPI00360834E5
MTHPQGPRPAWPAPPNPQGGYPQQAPAPGPVWPRPGPPQGMQQRQFAPPAYAPPPPSPAMPPVPAGPQGGFEAASRRTGFPTLVLVELRKLTGTLSDRILLILAPLVVIGITVLVQTGSKYASSHASAADQISPTFYAVRAGHVLFHAALIKLIAGEWQHRSAQSTLLAQPSRRRYFLAQGAVVLVLWFLGAALQILITFLIAPGATTGVGATYLLGYRVGWVIGVSVLGTLLTILVALTVAMLVPNAAGALAVYGISVPVMMTISGLAPQVFTWLDPSTPTAALATLAPIGGPAPVIVSLLLWAALLALAGYRVSRRDLA